MNNTIQLVSIDPLLRSSYAKGTGRTTDGNGRPMAAKTLERVGEMSDRSKAWSRKWKATQGMSDALVAVDEELKEAGASGVRLTETVRPHDEVVIARSKYEFWVSKGKPEPGTPRYSPRTMKAAYVAPPNGTNHQWGGATDFGIEGICLELIQAGVAKDLDEALSVFWDIAKPHGFTPIIREPVISQSEAWHFDHLGHLAGVKTMFYEHRRDGRQYRKPWLLVSHVGNILTGTFVGERLMERFLQARLLAGGFWVGVPDGLIGSMTRRGLEQAGIANTQAPVAELIGMLDEKMIGLPSEPIA